MIKPFPIILALGDSPPPSTQQPVVLSLPLLTSHHYLFNLLDFSLVDVSA